MHALIETYRGFDIVTGSPEYGHQFAIAYTLTDGEGVMHFTKTIDEAKSEVDELHADITAMGSWLS